MSGRRADTSNNIVNTTKDYIDLNDEQNFGKTINLIEAIKSTSMPNLN